MPKKKFEAELEALDQLRADPATAPAALRKALQNKNNYFVAKAAKITAALELRELIPDLLTALDRFFEAPDPQCWAKNALVDALMGLGNTTAETYIRGLHHIQLEPVWGGTEDAAGPLRARCIVAITQSTGIRDLELLRHLVDRLVDSDKNVRTEAAHAIGRIDREESALLLRLKALSGDAEPEVLGAALCGIVDIEKDRSLEFIHQFLERSDDATGEAALALARLKTERALDLLKSRFERERETSMARVLLTAIALTRLESGIAYLEEMVRRDAPKAKLAAEALRSIRAS